MRGKALGFCKTCGTKLRGRYCHDCGHDSLPMARRLKDLGTEFVDSIFSYTTAVPRTAWALIHEPGSVPEAHREGDKSRFLPPIRLYLTASLLFFLFLGVSGTKLLQLTAYRTSEEVPWVLSTPDQWLAGGFRITTVPLERPVDYKPDPLILAAFDKASRQGEGANELDRELMSVMHATLQDPSKLNADLSTWMSRALWLMMPLYGLLLWPLYSRGRLLIEHVIFALWAHSILFLMLAFGAMWNLIGVGYGLPLALIGYQVWITRGLKGYYGSSWVFAVLKGAVHSAAYVVLLWGPVMFVFFLWEVGQNTSAEFWFGE